MRNSSSNNNTNINLSMFFGHQKCSITNGILRYFGSLIFFIGIFSTILSIAVFARKPLRRKSCCFYFLILAISDSIHLFTMIVESLPYSFHWDLIVLHTSICKLIIFLIYFSNHLSNLVLTLASIDRFILIYCPSRSKRFCNPTKAKWFVTITILIVSIANGHLLYGYEVFSIHDKDSNLFKDCNIRKENDFYRRFYDIFDTYVESICFVFIPFILMSFCSLLIILQIFETRKTIRYNTQGKFYYYTFSASETIRQTVRKTLQEQGRTRLRDKDIQLCLMLIGTTLAFFILCLPTEINDVFNYTGRDRSCTDWFRKVVLMLLQQVYYAGHFYIYTLTGQLFRKHLFLIFFSQSKSTRNNTSETEHFSVRLFRNLTERYRNYSTGPPTTTQNGQYQTSFTTTSYVNPVVHRPTTAIHQINRHQSNDLYSLNDPSQRLLADSKYIFGTS